ncbi:MAG: DUF11 domain-containing protein [Gammaproteobacteria bacterium]|nr:DUF11 domain-containing protein [Gammaproteobacteria bacterium]
MKAEYFLACTLLFALAGHPTLTHAQADILVEKSADNAFPSPGQPVEFSILASNIGSETASSVVVIDQLPADLAIPTGVAPSADVGDYDPATGEWTVGDIDPGVTRSLIIPTVVVAAKPRNCIVNTATSMYADADDSNDFAKAVIHQNGTERCVDLDVGISVSTGPVIQQCDQPGNYSGDVQVTNYGPDTARNVELAITLDQFHNPNVRFSDTDCINSPSATCRIGDVASGETVTIDVTSDSYQSDNGYTQPMTVAVSTTDSDHDSQNNSQTANLTVHPFSHCFELDIEIPLFAGAPGCFIATAAYGSPVDERLDDLRAFRDRFLLTNAPGRSIVDLYYKHSPAMANFIAERDWLRAIVRGALAPLIFALDHPFLAATGLIWAIVILLLAIRANRRKSREATIAAEERPLTGETGGMQ